MSDGFKRKERKITSLIRPEITNRRPNEKATEKNQEIVSLPIEEYIEFLRDMRDIINLHKDYFIAKMSIFYSNNNIIEEDE